jgi:hypothetical protein
MIIPSTFPGRHILDLVSFPVLSQIKPQAPLLVVPFRQFLYGLVPAFTLTGPDYILG